jgi:hypothetical protein
MHDNPPEHLAHERLQSPFVEPIESCGCEPSAAEEGGMPIGLCLPAAMRACVCSSWRPSRRSSASSGQSRASKTERSSRPSTKRSSSGALGADARQRLRQVTRLRGRLDAPGIDPEAARLRRRAEHVDLVTVDLSYLAVAAVVGRSPARA